MPVGPRSADFWRANVSDICHIGAPRDVTRTDGIIDIFMRLVGQAHTKGITQPLPHSQLGRRRPPSLPSPSTHVGIWRCATLRAPRPIPLHHRARCLRTKHHQGSNQPGTLTIAGSKRGSGQVARDFFMCRDTSIMLYSIEESLDEISLGIECEVAVPFDLV
jgi:hypothetical protein